MEKNGVGTDFLQNVLAEMAREWIRGDLYQLVGSADAHIEFVADGSAGAMIFNTHTKYGNGEHWIAVFVDGTTKTAFLFDSLPVAAQPFPQQVTSQLAKMCDNFVVENREGFLLQNPLSPVCGYYCLAWVLSHIKNEKLGLCRNNWPQNDVIVFQKVYPYVQKTFE